MEISCPTTSRSVVCTSCTASAGKPLSVSANCTNFASALLDSMASEPPRRMQALPLLMDKLAASMVTLGRLSKIMPNTPIGTRICPTRMPLGCCFMPMISPMTSAMAANCSQPWAQVSSTWGVSLRRSTIGAAKPAAWARSMSLALSNCRAAVLSRSKTASWRSALFLIAACAFAIWAEAVFACIPRVWVYSVMLRAFMIYSRTIKPGDSQPLNVREWPVVAPRTGGTTSWPSAAKPASYRPASRVVSSL